MLNLIYYRSPAVVQVLGKGAQEKEKKVPAYERMVFPQPAELLSVSLLIFNSGRA